MLKEIQKIVWARRFIFWFSLLGLFAASYLLYTYSSGIDLKCGPLHGCDIVRASKWSSLFGIPTPAFGVFFYCCVLVISLYRIFAPEFKIKLIRSLIMLFAWAGFIESFYLTLVQRFALEAFCFWCLMSAASATGIFIFVWLDKTRVLDKNQTDKEMKLFFISLLLAVVGGSVGFYYLLKPVPVKILDLNMNQGVPEKFYPPEENEVRVPSGTSEFGVKDDVVQNIKDSEQGVLDSPEEKPKEYSVIEKNTAIQGPITAKVTLVEFMDFQCPACGVYHELVIKPLRTKYQGRIRFAVRHFPLTNLHPNALGAAVASVCAQRQNKFFEYYDILFENQKALTREDLEKYAIKVGLNEDDFKTCLDDKTALEQISFDYEAGVAFGITGTPTLILNDALIEGTPNLESMSKLIDQRL